MSDTPGTVSAATATTAMYLILAALRRFTLGELHARRGLWDHQFPIALDPEEKTLGMLSLHTDTSSIVNVAFTQVSSVGAGAGAHCDKDIVHLRYRHGRDRTSTGSQGFRI